MTQRVLWLTKGLGRGGAERLISLSVTNLDPDRFAVEVAYVLPWKDALVAEIRERGIPVHCLGRDGSARGWVRNLRRLLRVAEYDLVHTHSPQPAVAARVLGGPRRPVFVHTEHNVWQRYRWATAVSNAATYRRNAAVLAVSDGVAESIQRPRWLPGRDFPPVEVLHHGPDVRLVRKGPEARKRARRLLGLADDLDVIGTVGNFTPKKDQRTLLEAFKRLAGSRPDAHLVVVGSGPLEARLHEQARRELPAGRVHFLGSRDDVQELLPAFDVFALSSLHEGLSIAVLEAMAAGVACVLTRVGGLPELVTDGQNGLLVPPADPDALSIALAKAVDNPDLRREFAEAAARTARRFSIDTAVQRMEAVYEDLLARQRARSRA